MTKKQYLYGKVDYISLVKARNFLAEIIQNAHNDYEKTGTIKAFEFCYELAWKMMKRFLAARGLDTGSPKDTFRAAALEKLIDDPEVWFDFQKKRNLTVHTYEQENLNAIVAIFDQFSQELHKLVERLKAEI